MKTRVRPLPDAGRHAERGRGGLEHRQGRHHRLGQARVQDRGRRRRIMDRLRNSSCDSLSMEAWSRSAPSCALASHNSRLAVTHAPSLCLQSRARGGTWGWRSVRYETSVDVVSRHVLIAVLRKDAHHIPAARRRSVRQQGMVLGGGAGAVPEYQPHRPRPRLPPPSHPPSYTCATRSASTLPHRETQPRHNQIDDGREAQIAPTGTARHGGTSRSRPRQY